MNREITLNGARGGIALVDEEDYERINQYRWHQGAKGYVESSFRVNGKTQTVRMHRLILDAPKGLEIDHRNRNRLDNRRDNLRVVTPSVNQWNTDPRFPNHTGYTGVCAVRAPGRWAARIRVAGKTQHLGTFSSPQEAHRVYEQARALRDATGDVTDWASPTQARVRRGSANHACRVTSDQVRAIRVEIASGATYSQVARTYGITPHAVRCMVKRTTWAWLD